MQANELTARSYIITLKPLTPIHVWSGQNLVVGVDLLHLGGGRYCLVDFEGLSQHIDVTKVISMRIEELPKLLESLKDGLPCLRELKAYEVLPSGTSPTSVQELNRYVIPGSTLKGYIRTAILYSLLSRRNANEVRKILESGIDFQKDPKHLSEGLEACFFRAPRPRRMGFVDAFQSLLVSDPTLELDPDCYRIARIEVCELPDGNTIASQYAVVVQCGKLTYKVDVLKSLENGRARISKAAPEHEDDLKKLQLLSHEDLLRALRDFGCYILLRELERVRGCSKLGGYTALLEEFLKVYCRGSSNCVIARIGFGAGVYSKTVIGLMKQVAQDLYALVKNVMEIGLGHTWDEKTVKLTRTERGSVGLGWCELCLS